MLLHDILAQAARRRPDTLAVICADRHVTFRSLHRRVEALAAWLSRRGAPGDRVAMLSWNSIEYVELYYACSLAGRVLVPLNPRLHDDELAAICQDAAPTVLCVAAALASRADHVHRRAATIHEVVIADTWPGVDDRDDDRARAGEEQSLPAVSEDDLAWLIYTSGTTGRPKGARLTQRNLIAGILGEAILWGIGRDDVFILPFPMCHIAGHTVPLFHLYAATVVLMPQFSPTLFFELVQRHRVTTVSIAPTMISMLVDHPDRTQFDLSTLHTIAYGASPFPEAQLRRACDVFGNIFIQGMGATELSGTIFHMDRHTHVRALEERPAMLRAAGYPKPLVEVRLVDDAGRDAEVGEVGEILVRGDQVTGGYWNRPEADAAAFTGGWFRTGDLARFDDEGLAYIVDRKKDMVITGGANVYPREVEEVLGQHPAVRAAAVFGLPDPLWGENVAAAVQLHEGRSADANELIGWCAQHLASYKKPKHVFFVDALPTNVSGKVLKRELRARFGGGGADEPEVGSAHRQDRTGEQPQ